MAVDASRTADDEPSVAVTVEFRTAFAEAGNHTVSVNGTQAGPVVVSAGGGLLSVLSVLSFLALGLIGPGLGVLVGLAVLLTLARFVLRRVGETGETGGRQLSSGNYSGSDPADQSPNVDSIRSTSDPLPR